MTTIQKPFRDIITYYSQSRKDPNPLGLKFQIYSYPSAEANRVRKLFEKHFSNNATCWLLENRKYNVAVLLQPLSDAENIESASKALRELPPEYEIEIVIEKPRETHK